MGKYGEEYKRTQSLVWEAEGTKAFCKTYAYI
jgi:hypothetical protein